MAAGSSQTLVVMLAPPGPLAGIRDALQDWSALGLVAPFLWIERADLTSGGRLPGLRIEHGRSTRLSLDQALVESHRRIRLCVLVPALKGAVPVSTDLEDLLSTRARNASGDATRVDRLRCVVTRPRSGPGTGIVARRDWHNLVISPEDGRGPTQGRVTLDPSTDAIDVGPPAAAVIAAITGLWTGIDGAPLDDTPPPPGLSVKVIRAYHRRLDAAEIEARLRQGVTSMAEGLPRPRMGPTRSVYADNPEAAATAVAQRFWTAHPEILTENVVTAPPGPGPQPIGAGRAIMMFLSFLWATIKNLPGDWYRNLMHGIASAAAQSVQSVIFGQVPAAYEVVVNGVRPNGEPADWRDLSLAAQQLSLAVDRAGVPGLPDQGRQVFGAVWRDYLGAALTLADAGEHAPAVPYLQQGSDRVVLRRASDIAPGAEAAFTEYPSGLVAVRGNLGLRPFDALAIHDTRRRLEALRQGGRGGPEIDRTLSALDTWSARHRPAFTVQIGERLGRQVLNNGRRVRDLLARLAEAAQQPQIDNDLERRQRRIAIAMRVIFLLLLVIVGVLVVLGVRDVLTPLVTALSIAGAVVLWFFGTLLLFARQQRNLFAEIHRREKAAAEADINQRNLTLALQDLRRTSQAYDEFLQWSRIIGVVVSRPFGDEAQQSPTPIVIGDGMPFATSVGVARPNEAQVAEAISRLRQQRYAFGWLGDICDGVLRDASNRLGPNASDLREDPGAMFAEASGPDHLLDRWANLLEAEGPGAVAGQSLWQAALATVEKEDGGSALVADVVTSGGSVTTLDAFMAGVGVPVSARLEFDYAAFRPQAYTAGKAGVKDTWPAEAPDDGLARAAVTVQLSDDIYDYELSWTSDIPTQEPEPSEAQPPDPFKDFEVF